MEMKMQQRTERWARCAVPLQRQGVMKQIKTIDPDLTRIAATLHPLTFPTRFAVEVTAECNLACSMCHHPNMKRPKGKMPLELWTKCADQIASISPDTQCWFSFCGEPLLEPDRLLEMIAYGHSVGIRSLNINTNAMLLTPELTRRILDSAAELIVFGIDGYSKESYEKTRVNGERDKVYANVEHFLKSKRKRRSGPDVQIQFIVMDENEHEIERFKDHWLPLGATLKIRNKLSWGGKFGTPLDISKEERIPCPWAITMMHVFWDGRVPRCPGDTEGDEGAGNAWDEPLAVLWNKLGDYREKHLNYRFGELPPRCQDCKDWMTGAADRIHPPEELCVAAG
jgi:sulfatase maturation enzyme AslB (radical SAM superfamily)